MTDRVRLAMALAATLLSVACVSTREAPPLDPEARAAVVREAGPKISVGVREPVLALDPAQPGDRLSADRYLDELREARLLIRRLRTSGLFAQVDFTRSFAASPDLELVSLPPSRRRVPSESVLVANFVFVGASVGILPVVLSRDTGVRFARADAPERALEFSWPRVDVVVILALSPVVAIGALPGWRYSYGLGLAETDEPIDAHFAAFLVAHRDEIWGRDDAR